MKLREDGHRVYEEGHICGEELYQREPVVGSLLCKSPEGSSRGGLRSGKRERKLEIQAEGPAQRRA